jgi:hypothetical protein
LAISLYDATVLGFIQSLSGATIFLERGYNHFTDNGVDLNEITQARLFPDMLPFSFQVHNIAHHSMGAVKGAKQGIFSPSAGDPNADYRALQAEVATALEALKAVKPEDINALEGKDVTFQIGDRKMPFTAENFLLSFSIPNLHFHATTAYDILRTKGVPLGKRDYMGMPRMKMG